MKTEDLFDIDNTIAKPLFLSHDHPWEIIANIKEFIFKFGEKLDISRFFSPNNGVWIAKSAKICDSAMISPPCIIDEGAEIRHCAFIRGSAIIGKNAVLGNSCEIKNAIMFDNSKAPHFNYLGDSILGCFSHMSAGVITSNVKSDGGKVTIHLEDKDIYTNMSKLGALIGDNSEIGCGTVLCPGTVVGRGARIYPLSFVRGKVPSCAIYKAKGEISEIIE